MKAQNDITAMTAQELSLKIHAREVSCCEVMDAYLERIDRINPLVNAIVSRVDAGLLLKAAEEKDKLLAQGKDQGWLHGLPMAPKDLTTVKGLPFVQGSLVFKDNIGVEDSAMAGRLRAAGAIFVGKTNTPEFGFGSHTYNNVFGITANAYDQTKSAGGSSGGAAVALAAHMLPVADGSDMMGSLRNPAAYNNVFGFRPSQGRVPSYPSTDVFTRQMSYEGPMGRTVKDVAMLLSVQAGWDERAPLSIHDDPAIFTRSLSKDLKGVKIGWLGDWQGYMAMEDGIMGLCESGLKALESLGCCVEPTLPACKPEDIWRSWITLRHLQTAANLKALYDAPEKRKLLKQEALWEIEGGLALSVPEVNDALLARSAIYQAAVKLFEEYDYLAAPAAQVFPFAKELHWPQEIAGRKMDTYHRWMETVVFTSLTGLPGISVPVGFGKNGLPMGMQLIGRPHGDFELLKLAYEYEQATQWTEKFPSPLLSQ